MPHVTYVCTDPKANQHALYSWGGEACLPGQQTGGGMTEERKAESKASHALFWLAAAQVMVSSMRPLSARL
jgi:hypothetical protein